MTRAPNVPTDQAAPELLPCPFCGGHVEADWHYNDNSDGGGRGKVICSGCQAEMVSDDPGWMNNQADRDRCIAEAIAAWNRRADLAAPSAPAEVEGLVERLRQGTTRIVRHYSSCTIEDVDDADETMAEAATALTALQAENERLTNRAEVAEYKQRIAVEQVQPMIRARAEKAEAELAKIVEGIADDATAIPEACGKLHDLLCLPDDAKPSTAYDWAREAYDLLIPASGRAIDRAAHAKLKGDV
ncbi:Lar family restriction alleviation protein [Paracoccus sp. (in: a-proteobacteria)]|uniref:Lar family restriction alleviation protein n=1 Tax=Paracoccus sp. TaxID=267 RepID=UPI002897F844|nr:Lar family restriction alleviation protein [Paracoccus sp. (in: a-proteobacteria)]